eukprot:1786166-Prymnesium_polylepis.2
MDASTAEVLAQRGSADRHAIEEATDEFDGSLPYYVRFLTEPYKHQFFYWEAIDVTRKLLLTALLQFLEHGSNLQLMVALLIAACSIGLICWCKPYKADADNYVAAMGEFFVFSTLAASLKLSSSTNNSAADALLTLAFIAYVGCTGVLSLWQLRDAAEGEVAELLAPVARVLARVKEMLKTRGGEQARARQRVWGCPVVGRCGLGWARLRARDSGRLPLAARAGPGRSSGGRARGR